MRTQTEFTRSVALSTDSGAHGTELLPRARRTTRARQFKRALALLLVGVSAFSVAPTRAEPALYEDPPIPELVNPSWHDMMRQLLRSIYTVLGGDPADLDMVDRIETAMNLVRGQYETYGIPEDLNLLERAQLLELVLEAQAVLLTAPPDVSPKAAHLLNVALENMIEDLI